EGPRHRVPVVSRFGKDYMGLTYQKVELGKGRIRIRATLGYRDGKQVRKQRTFPAKTLKQEYEGWVKAEQADYRRGLSLDPSAKTVNEVIREWLETKRWS